MKLDVYRHPRSAHATSLPPGHVIRLKAGEHTMNSPAKRKYRPSVFITPPSLNPRRMFSGPTRISFWRQTGSNYQPLACKASALPVELCPLKKNSARSRSPVVPPLGRLHGTPVGVSTLSRFISRLLWGQMFPCQPCWGTRGSMFFLAPSILPDLSKERQENK